MKTSDKQQLKDGEDPSDPNNHAARKHDDKAALPKSCHENYGFEDETIAIPVSESSTTNNNNSSERLRLNKKDSTNTSVTLSENVAQTHFNDVESGQKLPRNGSEIELVSMNLNGSKANEHPTKVNGNTYVTSKITSGKDEKGHPLIDTPPLTDYFIPVNTHRKLLRGEKLYVTKDRRSLSSKRWRKVIICGIIWMFVAIVCVMAALAATGIIITKPEAKSASTADNFSELSSSSEPMDLPQELRTVGTSIEPTMHPTVSILDPSLRSIEGSMQITNLEYDDALSNPTSLQFQSLSSQLENKLFEVFAPLSIWSVRVNGFRPGSVWVDYSLGWKASSLQPTSLEINNHFNMYLEDSQWFLREYKINQSSIVLSDLMHPTPPASMHEETPSTYFNDENSLFSHELDDATTAITQNDLTRFGIAVTTASPSTERTTFTEIPTTAQFPWHLFGYTSRMPSADTPTTEKVTDEVTRNTNYWRVLDGWSAPRETSTDSTTESPAVTTESNFNFNIDLMHRSTTESTEASTVIESSPHYNTEVSHEVVTESTTGISSSTLETDYHDNVDIMHEEHNTSDEITDLWTPSLPRTTTEHVNEVIDSENVTEMAGISTTQFVLGLITTTESDGSEIWTPMAENNSISVFDVSLSDTVSGEMNESTNETSSNETTTTSSYEMLTKTYEDDILKAVITNMTEITTTDVSTLTTEPGFNLTEMSDVKPNADNSNVTLEDEFLNGTSNVAITESENFTDSTTEVHDMFMLSTDSTPSSLNSTPIEEDFGNGTNESDLEFLTVATPFGDLLNTSEQETSTEHEAFSTPHFDFDTATAFLLDNVTSLNETSFLLDNVTSLNETSSTEKIMVTEANVYFAENDTTSEENLLSNATTLLPFFENETSHEPPTNNSLESHFHPSTMWPILFMNETIDTENATSSLSDLTDVVTGGNEHDNVTEATSSVNELNVTQLNKTSEPSADNPLFVVSWANSSVPKEEVAELNDSSSSDKTTDSDITEVLGVNNTSITEEHDISITEASTKNDDVNATESSAGERGEISFTEASSTKSDNVSSTEAYSAEMYNISSTGVSDAETGDASFSETGTTMSDNVSSTEAHGAEMYNVSSTGVSDAETGDASFSETGTTMSDNVSSTEAYGAEIYNVSSTEASDAQTGDSTETSTTIKEEISSTEASATVNFTQNLTDEDQLEMTTKTMSDFMSNFNVLQNESSSTETPMMITTIISDVDTLNVSQREENAEPTTTQLSSSIAQNVSTTDPDVKTRTLTDLSYYLSTVDTIENSSESGISMPEKTTVLSILHEDSDITFSPTSLNVSDSMPGSENGDAEHKFPSTIMVENSTTFETTTPPLENTSTSAFQFSTPTIITKANFNQTQSSTHDKVYFSMVDDDHTDSKETAPFSSGLELNITVTVNETTTPITGAGTTITFSSTEENGKLDIAGSTSSSTEAASTTEASVVSDSTASTTIVTDASQSTSSSTEAASITDASVASDSTASTTIVTDGEVTSQSTAENEKVESTTSKLLEMEESSPATTTTSTDSSELTSTEKISTSSGAVDLSNPSSTAATTTFSTSTQATVVNEFDEVTYSFGSIPDEVLTQSTESASGIKGEETTGSSTASSIANTTASSSSKTEQEAGRSTVDRERNYYDTDGLEEKTSTAVASSTEATPFDKLHVEYSDEISTTETSSPATTSTSSVSEASDVSNDSHEEMMKSSSTSSQLQSVNGTKSMAEDTRNASVKVDLDTSHPTEEMTTATADGDVFTTTAKTDVAEHPNEINGDNVKQYGVQEHSHKSNSNLSDPNKNDDAKDVKDDEVAKEIHYGDDTL